MGSSSGHQSQTQGILPNVARRGELPREDVGGDTTGTTTLLSSPALLDEELGSGGVGAGGSGVRDVATEQAAVTSFYDMMRLEQLRRREKRTTMRFSTSSAAKSNRESLYLDSGGLQRLQERSQAHLARLSDSFASELPQGLVECGGVLRAIVAAQHYFDLDLEDLDLPQAERRSEDVFEEDPKAPFYGVCQQLLLDAARCDFVIEGEEFSLAAEIEAQHLDTETDLEAVEALKDALPARVVNALRRCLDVGPAPPRPQQRLLRLLSTAMSQAGLANLERACGAPAVVACGGGQRSRFVLHRLPARAADGACSQWELLMSIRKDGFEECVVCGMPGDDGEDVEPEPVSCDVSSYVFRSCVLRCTLASQENEHALTLDVLDLQNELRVVDSRGELIPQLACIAEPPKATSFQDVRQPGVRSRLVSGLKAIGGTPVRVATRFATDLAVNRVGGGVLFAASALRVALARWWGRWTPWGRSQAELLVVDDAEADGTPFELSGR